MALSPDATDNELMVALQQGDTTAYDALYRRWGARTFHFLIRRTGAHSHAEEAHQEAWLRVYRFRRKFNPNRRFPSWLYTIVANAGHDAREPDPESFDFEPQVHAQHHHRDEIVRALHSLEATDRKIILLNFEGWSSPEIGEMLDMSASGVRMRVKRARETMNRALGRTP